MSNSFEALGVLPALAATVTALGYETPTPIQQGAIPALLGGRDVFGQAQTGTGKTAAFALPMIQQIDPSSFTVQALVLTPTRELALQVAEAVAQFSGTLALRTVAIYGGSSYSQQLRRLREGAQIVIGTPGRVIDLMKRGALDFTGVRFVALDEADEMLTMGFIDDVKTILDATPTERQTALFSATLSSAVRNLAGQYMNDPVSVSIAAKQLTLPQVEQRYYFVTESSKVAAVARLLEVEPIDSALIFTRTKAGAAELADTLLARRYPVEAIHGDLSQEMRETVLRRFRRGQVRVLVATDVAARGLDIPSVSHVINFDMPYDAEDYVHRIGRTGRAGREGVAITMVTPRERRWLKTIELYTRQPVRRGQLPERAEVLAQRDVRFAEKITAVLNDEAWAEQRQEQIALVERLQGEGYSPEDITAAAAYLARVEERERPIEDVSEPAERAYTPGGSRDDRGYRGREGGRAGYGERTSRYGERGPRPERTAAEGEDRRPRREDGSMTRLMINLGHNQGVKPGDVVGAIASEAGIPGRAIGAIKIGRDETFVDVENAHVERVLTRMNNRATLRGQPLSLSLAGHSMAAERDR
jgi:ATP-dependent RNA helicase DeaD